MLLRHILLPKGEGAAKRRMRGEEKIFPLSRGLLARATLPVSGETKIWVYPVEVPVKIETNQPRG
jgi:hypothetical protein